MIVILSWYADGSGQPRVDFNRTSYREGSGFYGIGPLVTVLRETKDKECVAWEVTDKGFNLLYDSTAATKEREQ